MVLRILAAAAALVLLVACATNQTERDYGQSVRQMINAQVYNPATLTKPSDKPVESADPDMVNAAVEAMRERASNANDVGQDIVLQVGNKGR